MIKTSVIFPARNEEILIREAVLNVYKYLKKKKHSFEILIVVNGSTDATENILKKLAISYPEIKLLKSKEGYGYASKKGLEKAVGDYIVIYNVDFFDLKLIDLADVDLLGKDLIIGSKSTFWANDKRPLKRIIVSRLFNVLLKILFGFKGSDTHGIKVMRKSVIDKILKKCKTTSGIFDTEMVIRTQREGFNFMDYPVEITEKRPPRFTSRLIQTPFDIYNLYLYLKNK